MLWRDLDEVIRLTRAIIGNDCQLFVDNDSVAITEMMRMDLEKDEDIVHFRTFYNG